MTEILDPREEFLIYERYLSRRAELAESEICRLQAELDRARETIRLAASLSRSIRGERSDCRPDERDMM